jgi:hypothetical protein
VVCVVRECGQGGAGPGEGEAEKAGRARQFDCSTCVCD